MLPANVGTTMKDTVYEDGRGRLFRFHRPDERSASTQRAWESHVPVLIVPSLINRWYVMDLRKGSSLAAALTDGTPWTTYLYDWGVPEDEDRYESWDDVLATLERVVRQVLKDSGASQVALVGYCMGATLSSIYTALYPTKVASFVNLLGPIDFAHAGRLGTMVDPRWFDPYAMTSAGNLSAAQMQAGFLALSPTNAVTKWIRFADKMFDPDARESFQALETWANDNVPFPGGAYVTYIKELYQENRLVHGDHWARGRRVDLSRITCPLLTVVAQRDAICPPRSALALHDVVRSVTKDVLSVPGGHVGAMVGSRAAKELYPRVVSFLEAHGAKREALRTRVARLPESRL
jgi:polyhydroxyalkanoate synthase subunit PhaC